MYDVFISYSTQDCDIIDGLSKLLRVDGRRVFRDRESIHPGEDWENELTDALSSAKQFILFWCCHAYQSEWVAWEIGQAIDRNKRVIPVLLCDQPLFEPVTRYQWIDLRRIASHPCDHDRQHTEIKHLHPVSQSSDESHRGDQMPKALGQLRNGRRFGLFCGLLLLLCSVLQPFPNGLAGDSATTINIITGTVGVLIIISLIASSLVRSGRTASCRRPLSRRAEKELESITYQHREAVRILYTAVTEDA